MVVSFYESYLVYNNHLKVREYSLDIFVLPNKVNNYHYIVLCSVIQKKRISVTQNITYIICKIKI